MPFFDPILRRHDGEKLVPDVIAKEVRDTWKWNFNSDLVETFVPYLARQGWIVADIEGANGTSYTIRMADNGQLDASSKTVEAELRSIAIQFKEFSEALSPLTAIPREVEEFEDILVEWLLYVEAFSEQNIEFKSGFKKDSSGTLRQVIEVPKTTTLRDEEVFLCARFVKHAIEENAASSEVLARIASIGLLTEVVQDFVKPVSAVEQTDLIVYLDAPVAMELLGVSGRSARENTAPVVAELIRIGASVRIFGQSLDEIKNSLQAVLKNVRPTGPTAQAMLRGDVLREYVIRVSQDPVTFLEDEGVRATYRTLEQTPAEHPYFTTAHWQELYGKLGYSENPAAREHDTDISTFVIRQRLGRTSPDLFKSKAVVLTRNGLLAQIVQRANTEMLGLPKRAVSPVLHRRVLATAMWLRTGMGANDFNIPKRMLLANCERVLAIRPGVVEAVKRLTDAMGDEEQARQLDLLVSQDRSTQALMDKTLGQSNVITMENLSILFREMLNPHLEEEREKGVKAVNLANAAASKRLEKANEELARVQKEKEEKVASLSEKLRTKQKEDRDIVEALCSDTAKALRLNKHRRICFGALLGLGFSTPVLLDTTPLIRGLTFVAAWIMAYLTATGGKLVGINISETMAQAALRSSAERMKLVDKMDQFSVSWNGTSFVVEERPELPSITGRSDLFS